MSKTSKLLLTDCFEIKGFWFLPEQDEDTDGIGGILRYSPDKITLDLIGIFNGWDTFNDTGASAKLTIYGFSSTGEYFTLFDCGVSSKQWSAPGFETVSFFVHRFYSGTQYVDDENICSAKEATFAFTNLDAWLDYNIISQRIFPNQKRIELILDIDTAIADKQKFHISNEGIEIIEEISYNLTYPKERVLRETTSINLQRFYRMSSDSELPLRFLHDNIQKLRRLLTLLIGVPMYFTYIKYSLPAQIFTSFGEPYELSQHLKLFYNQVGDIQNVKKISPNSSRSILIPRENMKNDMVQIFNFWFA